MKSRLKPFDIIIILLVSILTFFMIYRVYAAPQEKAQILIQSQNGEWTYPAEAKEKLDVLGPLGYTTVIIKDNRAWIENSPCVNQNCVAAGEITRQGQWAACLPNNILLMIQGGGGNDVDSIAW